MAWRPWIKHCKIALPIILGIGALFLSQPLIKLSTVSLIQQSLERGSWDKACVRLDNLWNLTERGATPSSWLAQACLDLSDLHSPVVDTKAQAALIHWLRDVGAYEPARWLLEENTVTIPPGEFILGSDHGAPDERPVRLVRLSGYEIDRFEVTHLQYRCFLERSGESTPRYWQDGIPEGLELSPVVGVSWDQAAGYCSWAGKRLPTEAEWERACRGDDGQIYPWGDVWEASHANVGFTWLSAWPLRIDDAWEIIIDGDIGLTAVGMLPASISTYGTADMIGNAGEWVADWYNWDGYENLTTLDPIGTAPAWNHVVRGSAWFALRGGADFLPFTSRCSMRNSSHSYDDPRIGFRCARDTDK